MNDPLVPQDRRVFVALQCIVMTFDAEQRSGNDDDPVMRTVPRACD
ncbi:MAG: hypothetical protein ACOC0P_06635 [Planctomycetota bacterium]